MRTAVALVIAAIASLAASPAHACDPAAFDFDAYLRDADRSGDGFLQSDELFAAPTGTDGGYGGTLDVPVNTAAAFAQLDADRDRKLGSDELWQWGKHTHNACAGWERSPERRGWLDDMRAWFGSLFD